MNLSVKNPSQSPVVLTALSTTIDGGDTHDIAQDAQLGWSKDLEFRLQIVTGGLLIEFNDMDLDPTLSNSLLSQIAAGNITLA